ncbi:MAG: serine/threonine protein kinase [Leptospirales bacterium]|nr:serine/threonine protein kinase [Leptospirales bacterium]
MTNLNEQFFALSPERVLEAVESAGYQPSGHCLQLNSLENRVYDLRLEDGRHVVAKFYRPARWRREQIQEEHDFLFELRNHEIPVCAPMPFVDGQTIHETAGIFCAVWPRTGGRSLDEFNDQQLGMLGRLCARMHNIGAAGPISGRPDLDADAYVRRPLQFLLGSGLLPDRFQERYTAAALAAADRYELLAKGVPLHRIHGDCHPGNILYGDEGFFFLDFDDFVRGPAVQDLWMIASARDTEGLRQRDLFLDGYRQFRDFEHRWLDLVEPLRSLRYVHYCAWIARRWQDPAFPQAFPQFGSDEYWETQCADLEEQQLQSPAEIDSDVANAELAPELTNKDFFWDWEERP